MPELPVVSRKDGLTKNELKKPNEVPQYISNLKTLGRIVSEFGKTIRPVLADLLGNSNLANSRWSRKMETSPDIGQGFYCEVQLMVDFQDDPIIALYKRSTDKRGVRHPQDVAIIIDPSCYTRLQISNVDDYPEAKEFESPREIEGLGKPQYRKLSEVMIDPQTRKKGISLKLEACSDNLGPTTLLF